MEGLACLLALEGGIEVGGVEPCSWRDVWQPALRPAYSVLGSSRGQLLRPLEAAVQAYFADLMIAESQERPTAPPRSPLGPNELAVIAPPLEAHPGRFDRVAFGPQHEITLAKFDLVSAVWTGAAIAILQSLTAAAFDGSRNHGLRRRG